ncbi:MAG: hypothetical protein QME60_07665 [Verrucomicrobiota bacterium]|nr:hypothetical protein [Verrucomicrobiota bacterium]
MAKPPSKCKTAGARSAGRARNRGPRRSKLRRKARNPLDKIDFGKLAPTIGGQRLYVLGFDRYIQYNGSNDTLKEIRKIVKSRNGNWPPYMPLPIGPMIFRLGGEFGAGRHMRWNGKDRLPDQVLRYVRENGMLPRYSDEDE